MFHFFLCLYCIIRACFLQSCLITIYERFLPFLILHIRRHIIRLPVRIPGSPFTDMVKLISEGRNRCCPTPHMKRRRCRPRCIFRHRKYFPVHLPANFRGNRIQSCYYLVLLHSQFLEAVLSGLRTKESRLCHDKPSCLIL